MGEVLQRSAKSRDKDYLEADEGPRMLGGDRVLLSASCVSLI